MRSSVLGLAPLVVLLGCGGAKGSFDGNVYRNGKIAFQVPETPRGCRVDVNDSALAFRDDAHAASVLVNARCRAADDRTPLVALTNHLLIGATEREFLGQGVEPFDGREALHTKLKAKWDGVPMFIDVFVLSKEGCVYDLVYFGAASGAEAGSAAFEGFARGFRTLPGSGVV